MNIPQFSIKNYQFTIILFAALLVMGMTALFTMPRSEDPLLDIPNVVVVAIYPGANPQDVESQVADLIEEAVNELDDIKEMRTTIRDGVAIFDIEFEFGENPDEKLDEVQRQLNSVKSELPPELFDLDVFKMTTSSVAIFQLALVSNSATYKDMKEEAERVKKVIEKVTGVRKVKIMAYPEMEVRIALNSLKMSQMNISPTDVELAIQSNSANIPGGAVKVASKLFNIKTSGAYDDIQQIENTVAGSYRGKIVYLKNIAAVFFDYEDEKWLARFNGDRSLFVTVEQKEGYNIFSVARLIKARLSELDFAKDIRLEYVFDQSEGVRSRINGFLSNLLQGIFLVGMIIFLVLGYRSSSLVMLAIPLSILIGLWVVDTAGFGLQQISIAGLVVALGLLVDNSIAIIENIERFMGMGYSRTEAAVKGTQQLITPIASATLTTVLAFIPMLMMPDTVGAFIKGIPVTVIATLTASFFVAVTLTPFLASKVLENGANAGHKKPAASRLMRKFVAGSYRRVLNWSLNHKISTISLSVLCLAGALMLVPLVGISFFPKAEKPQFRITVNLPNGSNLDATKEVVGYVESVLEKTDEVNYYASNIGHGNPRIYYNIGSTNYSNSFAEIFVVLKEYKLPDFHELLERLRAEFANFPNARIDLREYVQGPPSEAPVAIKIFGDELNKLQAYAKKVETITRREAGAINVSNPINTNSTDLFFNINRDKAMMLGVPIHVIDKTIRSFVNGAEVAKFRDKDAEDYAIVLRYDFDERFRLKDFDEISVKSLSGQFIPLKQLAKIEFKEAPSRISHLNMERIATILADLREGYTLDEVIASLTEKMDQLEWEEGYSYTFKGDLENRNESFGGMGIASVLALMLIFGVLVVQFKSFSQPLIIFSALPLAIIGSILALLITGIPFSFTAFVGFTSLIGIAINNSIVLVDFANKLREEGENVLEAVKKAAEIRFVPIVMTTLTTILGLLPLTLNGGSLWAPMGWVIIGGLLTSTFFVLLLVPVLYQLLTKERAIEKAI